MEIAAILAIAAAIGALQGAAGGAEKNRKQRRDLAQKAQYAPYSPYFGEKPPTGTFQDMTVGGAIGGGIGGAQSVMNMMMMDKMLGSNMFAGEAAAAPSMMDPEGLTIPSPRTFEPAAPTAPAGPSLYGRKRVA